MSPSTRPLRASLRTGALLLALLAGCATPPPSSASIAGQVVGREWPLKNAFVYVKSGLEGRRFDVPKEPVVLDQRGFEFVPRVFGIRAGQELRVTCADYTIHVVRCIPFNNPEFNVTMLQDDVISRVFPKPEVMVAFDCTHHAHMKAFAGVLDHPYFAVTGRDGRYEIRGLPDGTYTLAAWCEERGVKETIVTVRAGGSVTADFRFE